MITPEQQTLVDRIRTALEADARVESAWLSGSLGRGEGDAFSDIDVTVVVDEEDLAPAIAEYGGPRSPLGPTVWKRTLYQRIVTAVTPDWERYDLSFVTPAELRNQGVGGLRPLTAGAKPPPGASTGPRAPRPTRQDDVVAAAEEFLRVLGLAPVMVGREEWLVGQWGVGLARNMLIDLMVEANGKTGLRGGVKRLNAFLTAEQRASLEALVPPAANREALLASHLEIARRYVALGRDLLGEAWPSAFEAATRAHLKQALGLDV
jgi:hypothetical protein